MLWLLDGPTEGSASLSHDLSGHCRRSITLIPFPAFAADFKNVTYHRCYDGDTYTFTLPGIHPLFGEKISVRITGIDTPEIKGETSAYETTGITVPCHSRWPVTPTHHWRSHWR